MGQQNLWRAFVEIAAIRGAAPALAFPDCTVSFAALKQHALQAAALLAGLGVKRGDIVALQSPKRIETYALMLACLRLGATYVCLDPKNPPDRTLRVVARIEPKVLFAEAPLDGCPPHTTLVTSFAAASWPQALPEIDTANKSDGTAPAYLMFTSGSTGEPKGAVIPQMGVLSLMAWGRSLLGPVPEQRFTGINPLHFDNSVFDFYCGLMNGATLVPIETSQLTNPQDWVRVVTERDATVFFAVPTLFLLLDKIGTLTPASLPSVRHFLFGGEGFPIEHLRAFYNRFSGQAKLTNVYGPTETSCICSSLPIDGEAMTKAGDGFVSLGRMHDNFSHAVLDPEGQPVSVGAPGELWIGGPNVGLGYYRQPEETQRRFQQDPRQNAYRAIFYRTGDLVREAADGNLWFVGRADNQVKIAGHRIELEEIDFAVQAHEHVRRAVAVVAGKDDSRELVVAFEAAGLIAADELAAWCRSRLPSYMQPRRFEQLAELPQNANGKIDRIKSLALISAAEPAHFQLVGENVETTLREIWAGALNLADVGTDANFFDLGGTSLLLMRVHTEIKRRLGREVSSNDLFSNPKIQDLVRFLNGSASRAPIEDAQQRGTRQRELMQRMRKAAP